ncbi:ankyrin repeat-containing domain protein [Nemania sp. NC0429]|nr:ankyrin repeat-containing domain protein [Nemania sp. NC0429]
MPVALHLPIDVLYIIAKCCDDLADLSALSRSCRVLHHLLTPVLYRDVKDDPFIMGWACNTGRLGTIQRLVDAGADLNAAWTQNEPRWATRRDLCNAHPSANMPLSAEDEGLEEHLASSQLRLEERHLFPQQETDPFPDPFRFHGDGREWLREHAAINHDMVEYFEEDHYYLDRGEHAPPDLDWVDDWVDDEADDDVYFDEAERTRRVLYRSVKTFPQRCYWTPLHIAASWGHDDLVNLLLDNGAEINALSRLFCTCAAPPERWVAPLWTPLHIAMCHGHESTTRLLLSRGASTNVTTRHLGNQKGYRRFTALHSACAVGLVDAARAIVEGGHQTDVTVRDPDKLTPLAYAFFRGNWAMIDFLVEHGADINAKIGPLNALGHACLLGYYTEALRLLDLGATPQCKFGNNGQDPVYFHLIAVAGAPDFPSPRSSKQKRCRLELVNRLIKHGMDINHQANNGTTALMGAASLHRVDVVKSLLQLGADVHISDHPLFGIGALGKAIELSSHESQKTPKGAMIDTVRAILEAMGKSPAPRLSDLEAVDHDADRSDTAADVDIANALGIMCSLRPKHEDMLEVAAVLLRYSRAVEIAESESNLIPASILAKNFGISDLLLENGFNLPSDEHFKLLIGQFFKHDNPAGLRYILGIAPQILNDQLLVDAAEVGSVECARMLISQGISINCRDRSGNSLLFTACAQGDFHMAKLLLENGGDPDECTQDGVSLTTKAAYNEDGAMINLLLDFGASIHSSPSGKPARHPDMGFLDIVINAELIDAAEEIVDHKNYGSPSAEEISRHWMTVIHAPRSTPSRGSVLRILLRSQRLDPDQIFTLTTNQLAGVVTTPLHSCAAVSLVGDQTNIIEALMDFGANIHKRLPVRLNDQAHTLQPESELASAIRFEGTTPLEWAIEFSSIKVVRAFIEEEDIQTGRFVSRERIRSKKRRMRLMLLYAKAACRRQKPKIFSLLLWYGLDPTICDEDGNTIIHMICDYAETLWPNNKSGWSMEVIAYRSVFSIIVCLQSYDMFQLRNKKGVSGVDRVLQILKYSGDCEFRQTLAKYWGERLNYAEGSDPMLTTNCAAPKFADDYVNSLGDEESDRYNSDDESSDSTDNELPGGD